MSIESNCASCGRRLRVADQHAGKKARCPACGEIYVVPQEAAPEHNVTPSIEQAASNPESIAIDPATPPATPSPATPSPAWTDAPVSPSGPVRSPTPSDAPQPNRDPRWMFRSENGHIYGPVGREELNQWAAEGRVSNACQLQLIGGDGRWEPATGWIDRSSAPNRGAIGTSQYLVGPETTGYSLHDASLSNVNPLYTQPHRGPTILVLAILGCGCPMFSVMAWFNGYTDLRRMDEGRMDPSGRTITQLGMVLGIVMTVIAALGVLGLALSG